MIKTKLAKKLLIIIMLLFLCGCSESPRFEHNQIIRGKQTNKKRISQYKFNKLPYSWTTSTYFYAHDSFANVGDTIGFEDGVIKVILKRGEHDEENK